MQTEERVIRMIEAADTNRSEMRSILRLEQIAIKGSWDPALLTPVELKELCSLVLRHLTWERGKAAGSRRGPQAPPAGTGR